MVAFRVLPTPSSIGVFGCDKTGNQQGNSQDRNKLKNLHKSPLSVGTKYYFLRGTLGRKVSPEIPDHLTNGQKTTQKQTWSTVTRLQVFMSEKPFLSYPLQALKKTGSLFSVRLSVKQEVL